MKKSASAFILGWVAACLLAGCATGMKVRTDYYDASRDFSSLKTYAWELGSQKNEQISDAVDQWIRQAVDTNLQAKGYKPAESSAQAGFSASYQVTVEKKTEKLNVGQPYSPVDIGRGGVVHVDRTWQAYNTINGMSAYTYEEGTLILDLKDPSTGKILWRGSVTAVIDPSANPQKRQARINEAVGKMLATFPQNAEKASKVVKA